MRKLKGLLLATVLLASAGAANAVPHVWVDYIDFIPDVRVPPALSYTHSILDEGYTPLVDLVYDYELRVNLFDDGNDGLEVAVISQPGIIGDSIYFDLSGTEFGGWSLAGHTILALTGQLSVIIDSWYGDFKVGDSTLTAWGDRLSTNVPEPGTLGLLGLGLLGVAGFARRKQLR